MRERMSRQTLCVKFRGRVSVIPAFDWVEKFRAVEFVWIGENVRD
jgi:hypothetical protein